MNYKEKIDHNSSPLTSLKDISVIENEFFEGAYNLKNNRNDQQITFSSLRNRYIFLHTCHGVLSGESLFNGELSDIFGLEWQRENKDPHPVFISILQLDKGKTNNGPKLFGRCGRHINPNMCSVGAQGFYLMYQFSTSQEMDPPPDFCDNKSWFDIKLLTDANSTDPKKGITQGTYSTPVGWVYATNNIDAKHLVHLGQVLGACAAEMTENCPDHIRILGNWNP